MTICRRTSTNRMALANGIRDATVTQPSLTCCLPMPSLSLSCLSGCCAVSLPPIEQPYLAPQFLPYLVLAVFRYRAMSRKSHGIGFDVLCLIHITLHIYSVCVPRKDLPIRFRQTFPTDWQKWHSLRRSLSHHQKHRCSCL